MNVPAKNEKNFLHTPFMGMYRARGVLLSLSLPFAFSISLNFAPQKGCTSYNVGDSLSLSLGS